MKFNIFDEKKEPEKVCNLKLFKDLDGGISVIAVDEEGIPIAGGRVVYLCLSSKKLVTYKTIGTKIGFNTESDGFRTKVVIE